LVAAKDSLTALKKQTAESQWWIFFFVFPSLDIIPVFDLSISELFRFRPNCDV
jgi:hypothetical protein